MSDVRLASGNPGRLVDVSAVPTSGLELELLATVQRVSASLLSNTDIVFLSASVSLVYFADSLELK